MWESIMRMPARHLLDYDSVAVAVLISSISISRYSYWSFESKRARFRLAPATTFVRRVKSQVRRFVQLM
jgi:hypothetical protein